MSTRTPCGTAPLGELVAAAFDVAARQSADPREISRQATRIVQHVLSRSRKTSPARSAHMREDETRSSSDQTTLELSEWLDHT